MNLLAINIQSCTDLITNSSSEIFQLRTNETVEQVSETLSQITEGYLEPVLFKVDDFRRDRAKFDDMLDAIDKEFDNLPEGEVRWEEKWMKRNQLRDQFPILVVYDTVVGWFFDKENPDHVRDAYENYLCGEGSWRWPRKPLDDLQKEFAKYVEDNDYIEDKGWRLCSYNVKDEAFTKFIESHQMPPVEEIWDWGSCSYARVEDLDGCILVLSDGENSIPYETWDKINTLFNGTNYHLG